MFPSIEELEMSTRQEEFSRPALLICNYYLNFSIAPVEVFVRVNDAQYLHHQAETDSLFSRCFSVKIGKLADISSEIYNVCYHLFKVHAKLR